MVVLVTGAAHRIGREISITLAKQGYDVALHYKNSCKAVTQLAKEITNMGRGNAGVFRADLDNVQSLRQLVTDVASMGAVVHIVNNASSYHHDTLSTVSSKSFDDTIAINLKAPLFLSKEFIEYRKALDASSPPVGPTVYPSITNILDQKVASTNADHLSYTISKHGLHCLTEMLAKECAPSIRGRPLLFVAFTLWIFNYFVNHIQLLPYYCV